MWVKICANTNLEDALKAAELGADAVGFVFAASKRQVTAAQVAAITAHLPAGVERVGVFGTRDAEEIVGVVREAGLTAVQLHGGLDEELVDMLRERLAGEVRIIQTLHWEVGAEGAAARLEEQLERVARLGVERVLVDSKVGAAGGGTGVRFDWAEARQVFAAAPESLQLIVAGGLTPEKIAEAVARMSPWGVDVASGVEATPGRKDYARVAQFVANAHGVERP